jgi:tRNA dimethylallyltransferase
MQRPKIIAIVGATASGKTQLAIDLAKRFSGEVISCDSRQIYRGLDIGTGKVTAREMQGIPHHLLDIADPHTVYTGTDFVRDAQHAIADMYTRGQLPIIAGGTFFWIDLLRGRHQAAPVPANPEFRESLATVSNEELLERLLATDPSRAATIDPHNRRRLVRALEIIEALGHVPTITQAAESPYNWLTIGLTRSPEDLRSRYRTRAKEWLEHGLVDEVRWATATLSPERFQELGFEYTLTDLLINGDIDEITYLDRFEQQNWQYAKRQLTWLKRDTDIHWYTPEQYEDLFANVASFLTT